MFISISKIALSNNFGPNREFEFNLYLLTIIHHLIFQDYILNIIKSLHLYVKL